METLDKTLGEDITLRIRELMREGLVTRLVHYGHRHLLSNQVNHDAAEKEEMLAMLEKQKEVIGWERAVASKKGKIRKPSITAPSPSVTSTKVKPGKSKQASRSAQVQPQPFQTPQRSQTPRQYLTPTDLERIARVPSPTPISSTAARQPPSTRVPANVPKSQGPTSRGDSMTPLTPGGSSNRSIAAFFQSVRPSKSNGEGRSTRSVSGDRRGTPVGEFSKGKAKATRKKVVNDKGKGRAED